MTDSRNTTNPPSNDDPIVAIANEIAAWRDRVDQLDEASVGGESNVTLDAELHDKWGKIFAAQDKLSELRAQSAAGAIVQLGVANNIFIDITDNHMPSGTLQAAIRRHRRLIYSAIPVLCDALDIDQDSLGLPHFFETYLDPWNAPRGRGGNVIRLPESH